MELCQCADAQEENSVCFQLLSMTTSGVPAGTCMWAGRGLPQTPRFCGQLRMLQQGQRCNCSHKVTPGLSPLASCSSWSHRHCKGSRRQTGLCGESLAQGWACVCRTIYIVSCWGPKGRVLDGERACSKGQPARAFGFLTGQKQHSTDPRQMDLTVE